MKLRPITLPDGRAVNVIERPVQKQLRTLQSRSKSQAARFLIIDDRLWVGDAHELTHDDVTRGLPSIVGEARWMSANGVLIWNSPQEAQLLVYCNPVLYLESVSVYCRSFGDDPFMAVWALSQHHGFMAMLNGDKLGFPLPRNPSSLVLALNVERCYTQEEGTKA